KLKENAERYKKEIIATFNKCNFTIHGTSQGGYSYNPMPTINGTPLGSSIFNAIISPTVKAYNIPVVGSVALNYDLISGKYYLNQFSVGFDKSAFKQMLQDRVTGLIKITNPDKTVTAYDGYEPDNKLPNYIISQYTTNPYNLNGFSTVDKTTIQQSR